MKFAIACSAVIPLRPEASEKSEMLTQIMFGEHLEVFGTVGNWANVKNSFDGYLGWIDKKTLVEIGEKQYNELNEQGLVYVLPELFSNAIDDNNNTFILPAGSSLPNFNINNSTFNIAQKVFKLTQAITQNNKSKRELICDSALNFINSPYLWGGKNPFGIDCSGLSQVTYKIAGVAIPRDASKQVSAGVSVNFLSETKPGDLAFFDNEEGIITHVGILLSPNKIIHASGKVRIDSIDHQGIYNNELNKYTHKLRVVMNMIGDI
ncbi:MAG: C40 family peptidase [Bacteroidia bacterium]|nr:C40 family peptidase [Bacteroidia bacterium]